jgi:hypothetical protein
MLVVFKIEGVRAIVFALLDQAHATAVRWDVKGELPQRYTEMPQSEHRGPEDDR